MAAIITLMRCACGASLGRALRSFGTTASARITSLGRMFYAFGPTAYLTNPTPTVTCSGPMVRSFVTSRNPARHGVTPMAPQDFPLCAAFQEE